MGSELRGRVLLITGASSGIGAATAVEAGRMGMRVVLAARRRKQLDEVADRVREAGGEALAVECDLADDAQIDALFEQAVAEFGRVDALFANAGYGFMHRGDATTGEADEEHMWRVNYFACVRCCRAAASIMREHGSGHIILCSSIVGRIGLPYYSTYAATKAAQHSFAASLVHELKPDGIHVSCVYPVGTRTEFFEVSASKRGSDGVSTNTPQMFMQTSEHVARRVVRCLRRPKPEVWPSFVGRFGTVILTMFPRLASIGLKGHARGCRKMLEEASAGRSDRS